MTLTFFANYLNHHQVGVADELHHILGKDFRFVATLQPMPTELKGGEDYSLRPYCVLPSNSQNSYELAKRLSVESDVCIFGACSQQYAIERAKYNSRGLSFEVAERWLKKGWINILSPVFMKWWLNYFRYYKKAEFYKLCCSAYTSSDDLKLGVYKGKHFKWGYFTSVPEIRNSDKSSNQKSVMKLLWIARFLSLKHPELPLKMAKLLKEHGKSFTLDYYGTGPEESRTKQMAVKMGLVDIVSFHGFISNDKAFQIMRDADVFLFTSNRLEGWGAVANESMANSCALVTSDAIGSTPYLVKSGFNGFSFKSGDVKDLTNKVEFLIENPNKLNEIKDNAYETMRVHWNPRHAAESLLILIDDLQNGRESSIEEGPCSKA